MRICTLLFASAACLATHAGAAPSSTGEVDMKMAAVLPISAERGSLPDADAATLAGAYSLSNGAVLHVTYERRRLFADLGERKTELLQTGPNSFIGRGSALQFTFDPVPFATGLAINSR